MIQAKRVYEPAKTRDGARFLVDRLWPRGLAKKGLRLTGWLKETAPSEGLRKWFGHDPEKWNEFRRRYGSELDRNPDAWRPLLTAAQKGPVTLLFAARDQAHNNAVALKAYLESRMKER
jgi:uncharacterized protein YeaO (DUF488 family)